MKKVEYPLSPSLPRTLSILAIHVSSNSNPLKVGFAAYETGRGRKSGRRECEEF